MERTIGTTDLRQQLTDILIAIREEGATYIVETFNRPQAALVNLEEYREFLRFREERAAFFERTRNTSQVNAEVNAGLTEQEILLIIEQARLEAAESHPGD